MSDSIYCPDCRRPQRPREQFGKLFCAECDADLTSRAPEAREPVEAKASGPSALDEAMPSQSRPTGAMTLLRNNLRSEERDKQGSWLENLLPRRGKGPAEPEPSTANRDPREPEGMTTGKKAPPGPHRPVIEAPDESPSPAPILAEPAAGPTAPGRGEGTEADRGSILETLTFIVVFAIASAALLPGNEAWAGVLFLLTVALLGASIVGILHRRQARRASWQGFALFGFGYLAMAFVPSFPHQAGLELPTSKLVRLAYARATASAEDPRDSFQIMKATPVALQERPEALGTGDPPRDLASMIPASGNIKEFMIVGHCMFTLLAALIGSAIARLFYRSNLASP